MRKYFIFGIVVLPVFIAQIGSTAVTVAFPMMVSHYNTSLVMAGWVLNVYMLVTVGTIPLIAKLSDNVGRRSTFVLCVVLFTVGSFLCSIAPNIGWLIFFRAIQGIGGGGFMSSVTAIVSDEYPGMRQKLIGFIVSVATFGSIAGPNIGGVIVEYMGWQAIFWLNAPFGIVALILAWMYIKPDVKGSRRIDLDFVGVGMLLGFASAIVISVTLMDRTYGLPWIWPVLMALLGILLLVMFIYRCKKRSDAVFTPQMLVSRPFLAANIFNLAYGATGENGIMTLLPLYAVSVYGMSTVQSGLVSTPRSFGVFVMSLIASFYVMKWGYHRPIIIGTLITAVGLILLALEPGRLTLTGTGLPPMALVLAIALVAGVGSGLVAPASNNSCIDIMPEKAASITGLRQICRRIGQTISIAICTLVLEFSPNMAWGFTMLLIAFTFLTLLSIVAVFWMPASPTVSHRPSRRVATAKELSG